MIGRTVGTTPDLEEFFDFRISAEDQIAFSGDSIPGTTMAVDMLYAQTVLSDHNNKHFGADRKANQYDIGTDTTRKRIVRGMEEKAASFGAKTGSESYFMFNTRVGYEGTEGAHPGAACECIRVDTPGTNSQHSHPIPTDGPGGHDAKIKDVIRYLTVQKEEGLPYLVQLAKYLRIIGTQNGKYKNLRQQKALYNGTRPPNCVYWTW